MALELLGVGFSTSASIHLPMRRLSGGEMAANSFLARSRTTTEYLDEPELSFYLLPILGGSIALLS